MEQFDDATQVGMRLLLRSNEGLTVPTLERAPKIR